MTRRKTRPLSPHEILSSLSSSQECMGNTPSSSFSSDDSSQQEKSSCQNSIHELRLTMGGTGNDLADHDSEPLIEKKKLVTFDCTDVSHPEKRSETQPDGKTLPTVAEKDQIISDNHVQSVQGHNASASKTSSVQTSNSKWEPSYLSNQRRAPFAIHEERQGDTVSSALSKGHPDRIPSVNIPPPSYKRTSSLIRLSMSLDGKARVITDVGTSPSPPRIRRVGTTDALPRMNGGLQRSQSAIEPNSSISAFPARSMSGRSRDARTWEFYCDTDACNALTEQAEREKSGSAIGPIGLIRSQSNKATASNLNKRIANLSRVQSTKRQKSDDRLPHKPKLARAVSSVGRLQTVDGNVQKHKVVPKDKRTKPESQFGVYDDLDGDSDKENWEPGTQISSSRRRRETTSQSSSQGRRGVLKESLNIPSQSSSLDALMSGDTDTPRQSRARSKEADVAEIVFPGVDNGVAKPIGESAISREVEDLEGVQNLLSLSKAVWQ